MDKHERYNRSEKGRARQRAYYYRMTWLKRHEELLRVRRLKARKRHG